MSDGSVPGAIEIAHDRPANGLVRTGKKNGAAKRPAVAKTAEVALEGFVAAQSANEAEPIDAPMWPHQPAIWLQPNEAPAVPSWSGLGIERHNRIPAPDFLTSVGGPANREDSLENSPRPFTPSVGPGLPQSDLVPLGWDPRADCPKAGNE
jgi:hypothetical protein